MIFILGRNIQVNRNRWLLLWRLGSTMAWSVNAHKVGGGKKWCRTLIINEATGCIAARNASAWAVVNIGAPKRCQKPQKGKQIDSRNKHSMHGVLDFVYQDWSSCLKSKKNYPNDKCHCGRAILLSPCIKRRHIWPRVPDARQAATSPLSLCRDESLNGLKVSKVNQIQVAQLQLHVDHAF